MTVAKSDTTKSTSLTDTLADGLWKLINSGELKPGEKLLEEALAKRFGSSRGPLREAIRMLEAQGLVVTIPNRGSFVRVVSRDEAEEIYDMRAVIFGLVGRYLVERQTDEFVTQATALVSAMETAANAEDFDAYYPANLAFHQLLIQGCGSKTLAIEYHALVSKLYLFRTQSLVQVGNMKVSNKEHIFMLAAIESGDAATAEAAFRLHVSKAKSRMLAAL